MHTDTPLDVQLRRLRAALRMEQMRGRSSHWTYDLSRHLSLARQVRRIEALIEERAKLQSDLASGIALDLAEVA